MCGTCQTPSPGNWSLVASGAAYWTAEALTAALEMDPATPDMALKGYLLTEGVPTGDRRLIEKNALSWDLPVPLMRVVENRGGHDGQFTVGAITQMEREEDGRIRWAGRLFTTEAGFAARQEMKTRYMEAGLKYGLSADLDDAEVDVEFAESDDGLVEVKMQTLKSGRVRGATLCDVPAFIDAYAILNEDDVEDDTGEIEDEAEEALVAAAVRLVPAAWYADPKLSEPTPLTVTAEGRIYGHIATWNQCHTGFPGMCVKAPKSPSKYSYFRTGLVYTSEGAEVAVGHLTMDTGHASTRLSAKATVDHYDHTGSIVADLAAGEDSHGIWVAGSVRMNLDAEKVQEIRAAAVSGDWREINGSLELVALLSVPVPGFPVPRAKALSASGSMKSLIATAVIQEAPVDENTESADVTEDVTLEAEIEAAAELVEETPVEIANEVEEIVAEIEPEVVEETVEEPEAVEETVEEPEAEELPELVPAVEGPDVAELLKNLDALVGPSPKTASLLDQLDRLAGV